MCRMCRICTKFRHAATAWATTALSYQRQSKNMAIQSQPAFRQLDKIPHASMPKMLQWIPPWDWMHHSHERTVTAMTRAKWDTCEQIMRAHDPPWRRQQPLAIVLGLTCGQASAHLISACQHDCRACQPTMKSPSTALIVSTTEDGSSPCMYTQMK